MSNSDLSKLRGPNIYEKLLSFCSSDPFSDTKRRKQVKGGTTNWKNEQFINERWRELVFKEDGQEYAKVLQMLGDCRCECLCIDGRNRLSHIRGKLRKRVWIATGDIVLVGLRDYQDHKADVIHKYTSDEARLLKAYGELPEDTVLNEGIAGGLDEENGDGVVGYVEFDDEDIDRI